VRQERQTKIALVSDSLWPFTQGGKEMRILKLARELTRLGQDVQLYTMKWWEGGDTYEYEGLTYHALSPLYPLYVGERRSIKEGLLFGLACFKMLRYEFDIIETDHMPYFPLFSTKIVALLKRKPLYATWHEVVGWHGWKSYMGFGGAIFAYLIERMSVHLPNHIVAVSRQTQQGLRNTLHYRGELSLVANGIDYDHIRSVAPATRKTDVMFTGRLVTHKNVNLLIEAIALLKAEMPKIQCLIGGTGPEAANLKRQIIELGLQRNVTLAGRLESSDDVYAYMKSSKVFVSPSVREGFGITIIEAYACGLSVVTVEHADNAARYLIKKGTGLVCEPTAQAVADSIRTLLTRSKQQNAKVDASVYDWQALGKQLNKVYAS
jgi:glycosyltransferase involved in cell wall biosynthesis